MIPLRIMIDREALAANWRWFRDRAGVPAAAAVKADGYGLGARLVVETLYAEGARSFLVSTFAEADALGPPGAGAEVLVLHGFTSEEAPVAARLPWVRPVLNTQAQVAAWASAFPGRPADLMVETGMHRLGLAPDDVQAAITAVPVATIHSHLATADEPDNPMAEAQCARLRALAAAAPRYRYSLANSAAICRGPAFAFDLVRPGLGLYGGLPHPAARVRRVASIAARVIQVKPLAPGAPVGYGATWRAPGPARVATLNLGYADGMLRALAPALRFSAGDRICPAVGRISMDMIAVDVTRADVTEGDWLRLDFDLPRLAAASGLSQYELLVMLGRRFERVAA
ncbi:alanine racemase [Thermaurantiacus sp.]